MVKIVDMCRDEKLSLWIWLTLRDAWICGWHSIPSSYFGHALKFREIYQELGEDGPHFWKNLRHHLADEKGQFLAENSTWKAAKNCVLEKERRLKKEKDALSSKMSVVTGYTGDPVFNQDFMELFSSIGSTNGDDWSFTSQGIHHVYNLDAFVLGDVLRIRSHGIHHHFSPPCVFLFFQALKKQI